MATVAPRLRACHVMYGFTMHNDERPATHDRGSSGLGRMQIALGEHGGPRKTRQDSSSLGSAAQRLTLSRYVARLKPRCGSISARVVSDVVRAYGVAGGRCG